MSEQMKAALPTEDPSEALAWRVAALANKPRPSQLPQRLAFAGALLVLVGGFWMNRPKPSKVTTQTTAASAAPLQVRYENQLPGRTFRVYDICRNPQGDILLLYTFGKTPEDALISDGTQDWRLSLSYQKNIYAQTETPIPFVATRRAISPNRVSPGGDKFEAICFSGLVDIKNNQPLELMVAFARENLHGAALRAAAVQSQKQGWPLFNLKLALTGQYRENYAAHLWIRTTNELVPQAWATAGVNVPLAIQQIQRNK